VDEVLLVVEQTAGRDEDAEGGAVLAQELGLVVVQGLAPRRRVRMSLMTSSSAWNSVMLCPMYSSAVYPRGS
jgi:hypothetical protein